MKCDRLRIDIERNPARSVPEKLLGDLYVRSILPQQRRVRVAESGPFPQRRYDIADDMISLSSEDRGGH
jgi:hypothetical protein